MRLRQLLVFSIIFIFLLAGSAGADENISENSTEIEFEGVDFNIPLGFNESKDAEDYDALGSEGKTCFYINDAGGEIVITVISDWMGMSLDELKQPGASKVKINGYKGWDYTEDGLHCFAFIKDEKGIIVGVTNETRLNQLIK